MHNHLPHRKELFFSMWTSRPLDIRDASNAFTQEIGLILFGASAGAIVGANCFRGTRVIPAGVSTMLLGLSLIGLATEVSITTIAFLGFVLIGAGMGSPEISANLRTVALGINLRRSVLLRGRRWPYGESDWHLHEVSRSWAPGAMRNQPRCTAWRSSVLRRRLHA